MITETLNRHLNTLIFFFWVKFQYFTWATFFCSYLSDWVWFEWELFTWREIRKKIEHRVLGVVVQTRVHAAMTSGMITTRLYKWIHSVKLLPSRQAPPTFYKAPPVSLSLSLSPPGFSRLAYYII